MVEDRVLTEEFNGNKKAQRSMVYGERNPPYSILHIGKYYPPHVGGMETHLRDLVSRQSGKLRVEVVAAGEAPVTKMELLDGARVTRVASFGTLASQPICPLLPWKLTNHNEDIVHLHMPNPLGALSYLMSGHNGKLVITHHADTLGRTTLRRVVEPFVRRAMKRASAIIVTSKRYLDSSEELADFREKCRVIPLGIDLEPFQSAEANTVDAIRTKYGPRILLSVGRLIPYKGLEFLFQAMRGVNGALLVIGSGRMAEQLENTKKDFGLEGKVHLLGQVKDVVPYYKAAQIFVLPSITRAEAFGLVQVEAMAAGIPVVNTDLESGVPEVSVDGVTGLTVPPKDPIALARAINFLLENEEVRRKYGAAAAKRAREEFSAKRMAENTLKVYESIL
jgi:glycosyltransferase involved in cell wall biosynthesis